MTDGPTTEEGVGADGDTQQALRRLLMDAHEPIALVGIGFRFPGSDNVPSSLSSFLESGGDAVVPVPADRWDAKEYTDRLTASGRTFQMAGGFLDDISGFDPLFFNISPKEADFVDPQQRLILETAWEALESANINPATTRGALGGVYVGISSMDYGIEGASLDDSELSSYFGTGTAHSAASGRVSYFLGWRGPSLSIDTACSSSLVAIDLAAQALRRNQCEVALAGGVTVIHHPRSHHLFSESNMLAPDGRCKTFDEAADGYGRSEGCGMVALKRLSDAKRDGDRVLALVRGSAVRQDGESGGLTAPSGTAQRLVMRAALVDAMLTPADVQYVEAHGTGTQLGDPIEMEAIGAVFAESHDHDRPVHVGSFKTNVGHMEAAAGIGGVIKVVMQMQSGRIFPHRNLVQPSRMIPWEELPVTVPVEGQSWSGSPRRALVNSFGFSGTIASVVLEQSPFDEPSAPDDDGAEGNSASDAMVLTVSAKTTATLRQQISAMRDHLADRTDLSARDIAYTSNVGRQAFRHRQAIVAHDRGDLTRGLNALLTGTDVSGGDHFDARHVVFLFDGQGSQRPAMGAQLYERYPEFARQLDKCDELFAPRIGTSVRELVIGDHAESIGQTLYQQPAVFALEYSLARLWLSLGVIPETMIGHSLGELVALAVADSMALVDAVDLVARRAQLMDAVTVPGSMISVGRGVGEIRAVLRGRSDVSIAAINAPDQCVVSGERTAVAQAAAALAELGVASKELDVSHAFHSTLMDHAAQELGAYACTLEFRRPRYAVVSTLDGRRLDVEDLRDPSYWAKHCTEAVDFHAAVTAAAGDVAVLFLEIGASRALLRFGARCLPGERHRWLASSSAPQTKGPIDPVYAIARAFEYGVDIDWPEFHRDRAASKVELPTYRFGRTSYWLPASTVARRSRTNGDGAAGLTPIGKRVDLPGSRGAAEYAIHVADLPAYLADHTVMGASILPASGFIDIMLTLQDVEFGEICCEIVDLQLVAPLPIGDDAGAGAVLCSRIEDVDGSGTAVRILSRTDSDGDSVEVVHALATLAPTPSGSDGWPDSGSIPAAPTGAASTMEVSHEDFYRWCDEVGLEYGPQFRCIETAHRRSDDTVVAELSRSGTWSSSSSDPRILDAAFQTQALLLGERDAYVVAGADRVVFGKKPRGEAFRSVVRVQEMSADTVRSDVVLWEDDRVVAIVCGLRVQRAVRQGASRGLSHLEPRWLRRSLSSRPRSVEPRIVTIDAADTADDVEATLATVPTDVCWWWSDALDEAANYDSLLGLVRSLAVWSECRLWIVTRGGQYLPGDPVDAVAPSATVWGFAQVLGLEYPRLRPTVVDLPPEGDHSRTLVDEVTAGESREYQVAYRSGERYVRRLCDLRATGDVAIGIAQPGDLGSMTARSVVPQSPGADEVRVAVRSAGLNFKDFMYAMGLLERPVGASSDDFGFECAGVVVEAGPDADVTVGDDVLVVAAGAMRTSITAPSRSVIRMPDALSFAQAASLPVAYLSAYYSLHTLAGLARGERVLIHAAAGGVGQMAVQLAQRAGAEVFATASAPKHDFVRSRGIEHVMDSRETGYREAILHETRDEGVDVVLNTLIGEHLEESVGCLRKGGRLVDLSKTDRREQERILESRPDVEYFNFDLESFDEDVMLGLVHDAMGRAFAELESGDIVPPTLTEFSLDEADEAFRFLGSGRSVGKVMLSVPGPPDAPSTVVLDAAKTYLVTGGLGALGTEVARTLVGAGARDIVLVSRTADGATVDALSAELGEDVQVGWQQCDVGDAEDVERLADALAQDARTVGGVVHAAGVLADRAISSESSESMMAVFHPKVAGLTNLHRASGKWIELDFFVAFASATGVMGQISQGAYAAANAFMDDLVRRRRGAGLPGLSIDWGPWAEIGMATKGTDTQERLLARQGVQLLGVSAARDSLVELLGTEHAQVLVADVDWDKYIPARPIETAVLDRIATSRRMWLPEFDVDSLTNSPPLERVRTIADMIQIMAATVLHIGDVQDMDQDSRFADLGLDSLVAVELKNSLEAVFELRLPVSVAVEYPTVAQLSTYIDTRLFGTPADEESA